MEDDKPVVDTLLTSIVRPERRSPSGPFGAVSMAAPVILDLDGKGVQTIARAAGGVRYDLDGDGLPI